MFDIDGLDDTSARDYVSAGDPHGHSWRGARSDVHAA